MSAHRGVFLIAPSAKERKGWRVRFRDPDLQTLIKKTLPAHLQPDTKTAAKLRTNYCVKKLAELTKRKEELRAGAVAKSQTSIDVALAAYYETIESESTRCTYATGTDRLRDWIHAQHIATLDDLRRSDLMRFRDRLAHEPWAPATFNKKIRAIKTFVGWAIDNDFCPKLHHDDLRRVKYKRQEVELRGYYSPTVLQGILDSAKRHDAEIFGQTRAEKIAGRKAETPCHTQITPFVVLVMLSGARLSEAVQLTWADFDPDALNENGDKVGEIVVPASIAKTKRARVIGLEVSPLLRQMLIARRLQTGGQGTLAGVSRSGATRSLLRMRRTYGAPEFTWQGLRRSTSTYLASSPQIYGSASIHLAAAQLGHSVKVAESHYTGSARGIARNAHTLEDAMQIKIPIGAVDRARGLHTA